MMIHSTYNGAPPPGMLNSIGLFYVISSFIIHFSTLLALFATRHVKPTRKTLFYSLLSLAIIYLVTIMRTSPEESVNYVYHTGTLTLPFLVPYLTLVWIPLVFIVFVLPTQLLQGLIYKSKKLR